MLKTLFLIFLFLCNIKILAHPMPNSVVNLHIKENMIKGEAKIPFIELENALNTKIDTDEITNKNSKYIAYFIKHIAAITKNRKNQEWKTSIENITIYTDTDDFVGKYQEIIVNFSLIPQNKADLRHFEFRYDVIIHQVITHKILVYLQEDWKNGISIETDAQQIGMITLDIPSGKILPLQIQLAEGSFWKGFLGMLYFGMQHIREGLDHILFLLTLLLIAPLKIIATENHIKWSLFQGFGYTLQRFLKISLAFTLGHSITLLVGSFNLLPINSQYIEIIIALSILISAIHAIKPIFNNRELLIALTFGLVHGLAFSYSLAHLELSTYSKIISIAGFNIGIEIMQIMIMLLCFPIILLSNFQFYDKLRVIFSCFAIIAALAWLVERITNESNMISNILSNISS